MEKYLNKMVVMTFLHPVGFPDGSAANLVEGLITGHNDKEDSITISSITICYRTNPLMSICLGAAERYRNESIPCRFVEFPNDKDGAALSWLFTTRINGMEVNLEIDADGDIGGSITKDNVTKYGDMVYNSVITLND